MPITKELGRQEFVQVVSHNPCHIFLSLIYLLTIKGSCLGNRFSKVNDAPSRFKNSAQLAGNLQMLFVYNLAN